MRHQKPGLNPRFYVTHFSLLINKRVRGPEDREWIRAEGSGVGSRHPRGARVGRPSVFQTNPSDPRKELRHLHGPGPAWRLCCCLLQAPFRKTCSRFLTLLTAGRSSAAVLVTVWPHQCDDYGAVTTLVSGTLGPRNPRNVLKSLALSLPFHLCPLPCGLLLRQFERQCLRVQDRKYAKF